MEPKHLIKVCLSLRSTRLRKRPSKEYRCSGIGCNWQSKSQKWLEKAAHYSIVFLISSSKTVQTLSITNRSKQLLLYKLCGIFCSKDLHFIFPELSQSPYRGDASFAAQSLVLVHPSDPRDYFESVRPANHPVNMKSHPLPVQSICSMTPKSTVFKATIARIEQQQNSVSEALAVNH